MKRSILKFIIPLSLVLLTVVYSCKKFLDKQPVNSVSATVLANKAGVDGLLIGAYSMLDENSANANGTDGFQAGVSEWSFGGISSDDANKGSNATDQPNAAAVMNHTVNSSNAYMNNKWIVLYDGIQRANDAIREIPLVKDGSVTTAYGAEVIAEARFLRGVYELELTKIFRNVPYVDENVTYSTGNFNVPNTGTIFPQIEADFMAGFTTLPATQSQIGRINKYAAEAMLAKTYMFEHKYTQALASLTDLMTNGVTSSGTKYALLANYADNFNAAKKNESESVFPVQMSVQDGGQGYNGNPGDVLNFPSAGPTTCCGFYQPSFSLVNAFKVDPTTGLPLLDGSYDNALLKSDQGVVASDLTYVPDTTTTLDARLDWTAGRRGIPFLDYGPMPGAAWARAQLDAGPYIDVKTVTYKATAASTSDAYGGWAVGQSTAINFNVIRYAHILLWAAECQVEIGSLATAESLVNQVRARAANPAGFVYGRFRGYANKDITQPIVAATVPAANYKVGLYSGQIAGGTKENARQAIQFEERLEFAMEGGRFFDLQRWDGIFGGPEPSGFMAATLNAYIKKNTSYPPTFFTNAVLQGATFTQGRNELYPLPIFQIDIEAGKLKQNPGY